MPVTEADLLAILRHCRNLLDAAEQVDAAAAERDRAAMDALAAWSGELADVFRTRRDDEAVDLATCASDLRADADAWAQVWADTVNEINTRRRADAVDQVRDRRGFGEQFVDIFHGDDSDAQVRSYEPIPVPTAASRYAATGGLETF